MALALPLVGRGYLQASALERDYAASASCSPVRLMQAGMGWAFSAAGRSGPCTIMAGVVSGKYQSSGKDHENHIQVNLQNGSNVDVHFSGSMPPFYGLVHFGNDIWVQFAGGQPTMILWNHSLAQTQDFPATRVRGLRMMGIGLLLAIALTGFFLWKNFLMRVAATPDH